MFRKNVYIAAFLTAFIIFLLSSPYVVQDSQTDSEGSVIFPYPKPPPEEQKSDEAPNTSGHYNLLLVITSTVKSIRHRKILREALFGIKNNLEPCMAQDGNVYYKFLIEPYKSIERLALRDFTAESVEYNDIEEFPNISGQNFQETVLQWAQGLVNKGITYNYLVVINDKTIINLEKLQRILEESSIRGNKLTPSDKLKLVWGSFMTLNADDMAIILGRDAISPILDSKDLIKVVEKNFTSTVTRVFQYYQKYPDESELHLVNDDVEIVEFPNAVERVSADDVIAVGHLFLEDDMVDMIEHLSIPKTLICHPRNDPNRLNIAVVTSSYVYNDLCMLPAARLTAENKRNYAQKHGYAFIGRSAEFTQQVYKHRKTVWGKFDAIEKILPHYDWVFWLDMDTVVMNYNVTIESLIDQFIEKVGGREQFEKRHLIVARPVHDVMINAGVFLMRNSEWSRKFLRLTQKRRDLYTAHMYEQRAMWDLMRKKEWAPGALLLDQDDRTFNTFPSRYIRGDFVVHYAPDGCPAKPIIDAIGKMKLLENNPDSDISLDHKMDH